jgi:hypothetical protein
MNRFEGFVRDRRGREVLVEVKGSARRRIRPLEPQAAAETPARPTRNRWADMDALLAQELAKLAK